MAGYYERLEKDTQEARQKFMNIPMVQMFLNQEAAAGLDPALMKRKYQGFLENSYHHVKVASQVYAVASARIPEKDKGLHEWLLKHAIDENGHHIWILNDLKAMGIDTEHLVKGQPAAATAALVGYMYYIAGVDNPVGILGDSYVIEGLSQLFATQLAQTLQGGLKLPDDAISYLARHGHADETHMEEFKILVNTHIRTEEDYQAILQVARVEFELYGWIISTGESLSR